MMNRFTAIIAILALTACAPAFSQQVQPYTGPVKPFEIIWSANTPQITNQTCQALLPSKADYSTVGCVITVAGKCTIFTPVPQSEDDYNVVHHEVGHCIVGPWHE